MSRVVLPFYVFVSEHFAQKDCVFISYHSIDVKLEEV